MWSRFDDKRSTHPKLRQAGLAARGLDEAAITQCSEDLTDGYLPPEVLDMLVAAHKERPAAGRKLADRLVDVHRWHRCSELAEVPEICDRCHPIWESVGMPAEGHMVHDYLAYNPTRAEELERRRKDAERKRKGRAST